MEQFLSYFAQLLLYTLLPVIACGVAVYGVQRLFCTFVTPDTGGPLLLAVSVLSVPVREAGQALACLLFAHRIEDIRFFDPNATNGEYGYVEHSYNPRNPLAVIGNFFFAIGPVMLGLFAILVVLLACFHGAFVSYAAEIGALEESGAGFGEYLKTAAGFFPSMFRDGSTGLFVKIIGCVCLLLLAFSVLLSPSDLKDALGGLVVITGLFFCFAGALCLFDARVRRMVLGAFRTFFMYLLALFSVALLFAVVNVLISLLYATVRGIFMPSAGGNEDEQWKNN